MIIRGKQLTPHEDRQTRTAKLYLNGIEVGSVRFGRANSSWGFGEFTPGPLFEEFATIFGRWSLLMHAEGTGERLSQEASEELRRTEYAIDKMRAVLHIDDSQERRHLRQVNIDGPLIEWKEV